MADPPPFAGTPCVDAPSAAGEPDTGTSFLAAGQTARHLDRPAGPTWREPDVKTTTLGCEI
ncbi:hypothetical protein DVH02_02865 [Streptomyces corynorhini]|uniref:Uncharacterized protein n=1 Tax=Streptomyces corynorhini TaxID=2282652 RepID=A0A370BDB3_9ACTN|nr:hypothetical protein DVH02_02865 [Streptomyces corynorhini]